MLEEDEESAAMECSTTVSMSRA